MEVDEDEFVYQRTLQNVEHILGWADLGAEMDKEDLIPEVQCLSFSHTLGENEDEHFKLLEVEREMLEYLKEGKTLTIRGEEEDECVLCDEKETFQVRTAETSNLMLINPNLKLYDELRNEGQERSVILTEVLGGLHKYQYLELKSCPPRLRKLARLLEEKPYYGKNSDKNTLGFLWKDFQNRVQCSENQLKAALKKFKVYEIGEYWYMLDNDYHFSVLSSILNIIDSDSLPIEQIDKEYIMNILRVAQLEPEYILDQCFEYFFTSTEDTNEQGNILYRINNDDVSKFFAQFLLKTAERFNLKEFFDMWKNSVPEGVITEEIHLRGIAIVDPINNPPVVFRFETESLPSDVAETFTVLFDIKSKWTTEEIQPYIQDFCSEKTPAKYFLTRYARSYTVNGTKYYSSKHLR